MMSSAMIGMQDFRAEVRGNQSKYLLLAVQAPLAQVASHLTKLFKVENWQQQVDRSGSLANLPGVPLVQLKGSDWTLAYWAIGRCPNLKREGRNLSDQLNTRVIEIWEADTSGWTEWMVWESGDEKEGAERMPDDEVYFRSSLKFRKDRDAEELDSGDLDAAELSAKLAHLADELLTDQHLQIPAFDLDLSAIEIDRLDLLVLPSQPLGMIDFQKSVYEGQPE